MPEGLTDRSTTHLYGMQAMGRLAARSIPAYRITGRAELPYCRAPMRKLLTPGAPREGMTLTDVILRPQAWTLLRCGRPRARRGRHDKSECGLIGQALHPIKSPALCEPPASSASVKAFCVINFDFPFARRG